MDDMGRGRRGRRGRGWRKSRNDSNDGQNRRGYKKSYYGRKQSNRNSYHERDFNGESTSSFGNEEHASANAADSLGFYYDKEKKKYFKILPGQHSAQNVVTKQNIKAKEAEKKRQFHINKSGCEKVATSSSCKTRTHSSHNVWSLLNRTSYGQVCSDQFVETMCRRDATKCKPRSSIKVFRRPAHQYEKVEHMQRMLPDRRQKKMLCLWSVKGMLVQRIQMLDVNSIERAPDDDTPTRLNITPSGAVILQSFSKISSLCWAPTDNEEDSCCVLYTTTCFTGKNPSLAMIRNLESSSADEFRSSEYGLGSRATWTCAWDQKNKRFSVGSEKCSLMLDVQTRRLWELSTNNSDVLAQTFSNQGSSVLYSGTRKGDVVTHDTRSLSSRPVQSFRHTTSISHIYESNDSNSLIVSDVSGKIKKWDLRKKSVVLEYAGHHNEYTQIPVKVDSKERILYSSGQDCFTRLWDFSSGELLHTIAPPHPASRDNIPQVCYLENLGGNTIPGILMGILDEIHFYSQW